jgi:hypothetical protein
MFMVRNNKAERWSVLIILVAGGFLLLFVSLMIKPARDGDAHEYALMQESLYRHTSVELRMGDLDALDRAAQKYDSISLDGITEILRRDIGSNKECSVGYIRSDSGMYYSIHFLLYSLLSVPIRILLMLFGADTLLSFQVTNAVFVFLAVYYIYRVSSLDIYEKHWLAALFLLSGTTYYLFWIHPEVYTASMFLIALLSVLDNRYILSVFCSAAASMQNPPVAFFIPIIIVIYVKNICLGTLLSIGSGMLKQISVLIGIFLVGGLSLLPSLFYLIVLGHPNPIVSVGAADYRNISLSRFLSLWFDLNQGVVLGDAGLFIGIIITLLIIIYQKNKINIKNEYFIPLLYFFATIIMTIPCLTTGNWNAGSSIFIRYGYWLVMMPIVGFLLLTRNLESAVRYRLMVSVIMMQVCIVLANKITSNGIPPGRFTGVAESMMYYFPQWYNPVPEIFAERSRGEEHSPDKNRIYQFEKNGKITKLLLNNDKDVSGGIKDSVMEYKPLSVVSRVDAGDGWYYLNGDFEKNRLIVLDPNIAHYFDSKLIEWISWSAPESGWRWSEGRQSVIQFSVSEHTANHGRMLQILLGPLEGKQRMSVFINKAERFSGELTKEDTVFIPIKNNDLMVNKINSVNIYLPDAKRPDGGKDMRVLGVYIKWMKIVTTE